MSEVTPNAKGPAPIRITPETTERDVAQGTVETPLPKESIVGESYPVVFSFTNNGPSPVDLSTFTPNYPPEFTENSSPSPCGTSLAPGATCTVEGDLVPTEEVTYTVGLILDYDGVDIPLSTSTTAVREPKESAL
ncbi:hypothetical protein ABT084_36395 [Streptomyces sp. NPDC002138]|uniref:hypothetical protein n=1 Tax=Streptomyces sp. NPDC002138 TaxID=3154410 RepID=UPI003331AA46